MSKRVRLVRLIVWAATLCFSGMLYAFDSTVVPRVGVPQQEEGNLKGTVSDDLGPVAGASVVVKGTTNGTITDMDGNFMLMDVNVGDVIEISFVGYLSQDIVWNGEPINVKLSEDTQVLDEVVVTALGMKRSTKALGYAMTEMKGEDLNTNVINPVSALQGKVAGVDISSGDGGLFGSSKILIRGASTLGSNNQPIYVVDGVILDNAVKEGDADWSTNDTDWGNELKNLNPDDFETVSVLKGAAATALYGSRGLNGAVVITTKSGKGKKGLGISFSQTLGIDHVYGGPDFQNVRGDGYMSGYNYYKSSNNLQDTNSFYLNSEGMRSLAWGGGVSYGPYFDGEDIEYYDYSIVKYSATEDNFTDAFDNGFNTNTHVAVQGSNDTSSFYTSFSYKHATGNTPNNSFERLSFLAKATHKLSKDVEIEAGISFANSYPKQGGETNLGEYFIDGTFGRLYDTRYWRTRYKGSHGGLADTAYGDEYGNAPGKSVWWNVYENEYTQKETSVRPNVKITVDLNSFLKLSAEGNYNYYYKRNESKELGSGYANEGGYYEMGQYTKEQTNANVNLSWNKNIKEDYNISGFIRGEYYYNYEQAMSANTNDGLVVPGQFFLSNSKSTISYSGGIDAKKKILSVAGQFAVSWKDQIFMDVTGRNDWSSSLVYTDTHGNYSFFYPSVSGSWLLHETFREKMPEWISFAKVRGSWAQVGNDTESYIINSAYTLYGLSNGSTSTYGLTVPTTVYSNDLKPERKTSWELGLDFRVLKNRIGVDFTYYKENTKDQIMEIEVPAESGVSSQLINAGNIQNKGVEIALNTTPIETKDWTWDLNFTYTRNRSKVISLHENVADYITLVGYAAYGNYRIASVAEVGGEYGLLKSDATRLMDEETGLPILCMDSYESRKSVYYDRDGTVKTVGSIQPNFLGSVNTSVRWKDLTLRVSLDMRFGGMVAIYGSHYGTAYGYLESSLAYSDTQYGGLTYVSIWDGLTYTDGYIPEALVPGGYELILPDGSYYTVKDGGETYASLVEKGYMDPQHGSSWSYWNNSWGRATVWKNNDWFHELNYIALREVSLSYRLPDNWARKVCASNLSVTVAGRNLGYLLNSLPNNFNPESLRGTQSGQFIIRSVSPYTASYTFTINATF